MKGRLFGIIIVGALVFTVLKYYGYFDDPLVQIRGSFVPSTCEEKTMDLKVISVSDSSLLHLLDKKISAELPFNQSKLNTIISSRIGTSGTADFLVLGYLVQRRKLHCSGSSCFRVRQIKTVDEPNFIEL